MVLSHMPSSGIQQRNWRRGWEPVLTLHSEGWLLDMTVKLLGCPPVAVALVLVCPSLKPGACSLMTVTWLQGAPGAPAAALSPGMGLGFSMALACACCRTSETGAGECPWLASSVCSDFRMERQEDNTFLQTQRRGFSSHWLVTAEMVLVYTAGARGAAAQC